jgi:hypothetical protein
MRPSAVKFDGGGKALTPMTERSLPPGPGRPAVMIEDSMSPRGAVRWRQMPGVQSGQTSRLPPKGVRAVDTGSRCCQERLRHQHNDQSGLPRSV